MQNAMHSLLPAESEATRRHHLKRVLLVFSPLILLFGSGCSCLSSAYYPFISQRSVQTTESTLHLYLDIMASGIFTPTVDGHVILDGETAPAAIELNALAEQGYVAVRVPHAPPTYTISMLTAGVQPGAVGASFTYFMPPNSSQPTTVPVTLTRQAILEPAVNARFPITDGQSHWEVWWLAPGTTFPIPAGPFRLADDFPAPVELQFEVDFGEGAATCHGCPYQYLLFDGATLHGPFAGTVTVIAPEASEVASFGSECAHQNPSAPVTVATRLIPNQRFRLTYCLENFADGVRAFQIDADSQQGWQYTFYTQTVGVAAAPVWVGKAPFEVNVPGKSPHAPGMIAIHAVYTPTFAAAASVSEALALQATSRTDPALTTAGAAFGATQAFTPQQTNEQRLFLPAISRP